jgi:serine/threonine protein kinase
MVNFWVSKCIAMERNVVLCFFVDLLLHEKRLSEAKAKEKFRQLVLAVEYIHSKNIVN